MLLSVLVPTWNRRELVLRAIQSALSQLPADSEIVISDNASTDGSVERLREIAARDARIRLLENSSNHGALANWRRCLDAARGEFVHWLWSDDYCLPGAYAKWVAIHAEGWEGPCCFGHRLDSEGSLTDSPWIGQPRQMPVRRFLERLSCFAELPVSPATYILKTTACRSALALDIPDHRDLSPMRTVIGPDLAMVAVNALDHGAVLLDPLRFVALYAHPASITIASNREDGGVRVLRHYFHSLRHILAERCPGRFPSLRARLVWRSMKLAWRARRAAQPARPRDPAT